MKKLLPVLSVLMMLNAFTGFVANAQTKQVLRNGDSSAAVHFTAAKCTHVWRISGPDIGFPIGGIGDIPAFKVINTGVKEVADTITIEPASISYAYIANALSNKVSVINTKDNTIVKNINVGSTPTGVSVSPDGSLVYITNTGDNTVSVIATATNTVTATIPVGRSPLNVLVSSNGNKVYVANQADSTISVINTATNTVTATIPIANEPGYIVASHDGGKLYVANGTNIAIISTATNTVTSQIAIGGPIYGLCVNPDGSKLYLTCNKNQVLVVNTTTNVASFFLATALEQERQPLNAVLVSPDNKTLYFTDEGYLEVADIATKKIVQSVGYFSPNKSLSLTPDGALLYITNSENQEVAAFSTITNKITNTIEVLQRPISTGNFIAAGSGCNGSPSTIVIIVKQSPPTVAVTNFSGAISACVGVQDEAPNIQTFTVSGHSLVSNVNITAPAGFEISTFAKYEYKDKITLLQKDNSIFTTQIFVRAKIASTPGTVSGNVVVTSNRVDTINVPVEADVHALPTVDPVANQTVNAGDSTRAVHFTGTGNAFDWVSNGGQPTGGDFPAFLAHNSTNTPYVYNVTVTPSLGGFAYVGTYSFDTGLLSTATNTIQKQIGSFGTSLGVSVSPNGNKVYTTLFGTNKVQVIRTETNEVVATIPVGNSPYGITVSPDNTRVYVANYNSNTVSVINTTSQTVIASISVGNKPTGVAVSRDGTTVYAANSVSNTVSVINVATSTVTATINVGNRPKGMVVSADGQQLYVANLDGISVINTANNTLLTTIQVGAQYLTLSPDGTKLYAAGYSYSVSVINTATNKFINYIFAISGSDGISITPDGLYLYDLTVTDRAGDKLAVLSLTTGKLLITYKLGLSQTFGNFINGQGSGCSGDAINFTITVNPAPGPLNVDELTVPAALSPNGDGINDVLTIANISNHPNNKLVIVNKSGKAVFEAQNYNNASNVFNGHSSIDGKLQPPGTYFYKLEYTDKDVRKSKSGYIQLEY